MGHVCAVRGARVEHLYERDCWQTAPQLTCRSSTGESMQWMHVACQPASSSLPSCFSLCSTSSGAPHPALLGKELGDGMLHKDASGEQLQPSLILGAATVLPCSSLPSLPSCETAQFKSNHMLTACSFLLPHTQLRPCQCCWQHSAAAQTPSAWLQMRSCPTACCSLFPQTQAGADGSC